MSVTAKQCLVCREMKPLSAFGRRAQTKDGLQAKCRQCIADYQRHYRHQKALAVYTYLAQHPCIDCGEADPVVLDFDHVRGTKERDVKVLVSRSHVSLARVLSEIEKCEVRCANCHRRATAKRGGFFAYLQEPAPKPPQRKRQEGGCGTRIEYQRGCRCPECREAQRLYWLEWSHRNKEASVA